MSMISPAASTAAVSTAAAHSDASSTVRVGYGASIAEDAAAFEASLEKAAGTAADSMNEVARVALEPLDALNKEAIAIGDYAKEAVASGNTLSPAEIVTLTVQSQKFMFHSQLTSNIANRTADGVQQLFRQQG